MIKGFYSSQDLLLDLSPQRVLKLDLLVLSGSDQCFTLSWRLKPSELKWILILFVSVCVCVRGGGGLLPLDSETLSLQVGTEDQSAYNWSGLFTWNLLVSLGAHLQSRPRSFNIFNQIKNLFYVVSDKSPRLLEEVFYSNWTSGSDELKVKHFDLCWPIWDVWPRGLRFLPGCFTPTSLKARPRPDLDVNTAAYLIKSLISSPHRLIWARAEKLRRGAAGLGPPRPGVNSSMSSLIRTKCLPWCAC